MKRKSIIFAAALSAVMTISALGTPCYAAEKTSTAVSKASEIKNAVTLKDSGKFSSYKSGIALAADADGTVYYCGTDKNGTIIYSAGKNGKTLKSYRIDNEKSGNDIIGAANVRIKCKGDFIYVLYDKYATNAISSSAKGHAVIKLDKKLNKLNKYEVSNGRYFDTNCEKIVYVKDKTIYMSDMNGKNKKAVYSADGENVFTIDSAAAADKHIGFRGSGIGCYYIGAIDIETGKVTLKKLTVQVSDVKAFGDKLIWSAQPKDDTDSSLSGSDWVAAMKKIKGVFYVFDGEKFTSFKTGNIFETASYTVDENGNIITTNCGLGGTLVINVYKNGKLAGSYSTDDMDDGFCAMAANGGVIAVSTSVHPEGADTGWYTATPGDTVEYKDPFPINTHIIFYEE